MPPPLAIIFDCDGVLVESEILGNQILAEFLTDHGYPCTTDQSIALFAGRAMSGIIDKATELTGRDMREACERIFIRCLEAAFAERLTPVAGMPELIRSLTIPKAVASNSPVSRLMLSLRRTNLLSLFGPHVYSADHVKHPKPAPDLFLHAAAGLGVPADRCLVIEDGPGGIAAAHAAGMRCIAFAGGGHCTPDHVEKLLSSTALHTAHTAAELAAALDRHLAA
jgi:HAD superfamily hydrolase (TIGR01509 family)